MDIKTKKFIALSLVIATFALVLWAFFHPAVINTSAEISGEVSIPCVMYHHVLGENSKLLGDYTISTTQFESDLAWLKAAGYNTVTANEIIDYVDGNGELPEKPIFITFDDGYESFYANAFPIMQKYNAKGIVSVIGRYSELYSTPDVTKHLNYSHINWEQMREIRDSGTVEIGNHSFDMHDATGKESHSGAKKSKNQSDEQYKKFFRADTQKLQDKLMEEVNIKPNVYAYPFGYYTKMSEEILKEMGFRMSLGCEEGQTVLTSDPNCLFLIKRYNRPHGVTAASFFAKMGLSAN